MARIAAMARLPASAQYFVIVNGYLHFPRYRRSINLDATRGTANACPEWPALSGPMLLEVAQQPPAPARDVIPAICVAAVSIAFAPMLHVVSPILAISVETLIGCTIV